MDLIRESIQEQRLDELDGVTIVNPEESPDYPKYVARLWELRQRRGVTYEEARRRMRLRSYFAAMMLEQGAVDGLVTGLTTGYADAVRPALEVIHTRAGKRAAGVYIVVTKNDFKFFADCTVNIDPTAEEMAEIALTTADLARYFDVVPRVAMLSLLELRQRRRARRRARCARRPSSRGSAGRTSRSTARSRSPPRRNAEIRLPEFPFSTLKENANVFVFPNLDAANIAYQLLEALGGAEVIGPVLLGMHKPVNVLQMGTSVQSIVNLAAITALRAQGDRVPVLAGSAGFRPRGRAV